MCRFGVNSNARSERNSHAIVVAVRRRTFSPVLYASPMSLELGPQILCLADIFHSSAIPLFI